MWIKGYVVLASLMLCLGLHPAMAAEEPSPVQPTIPVEALTEETAAEKDPTPEEVTQLEDIIVTATKRGQSIRDVPATVNAFSGEDLEKLGAQSIEDYIKRIPGISLNKLEGDYSPPVIRGIVTDTAPIFTQPTSGVYIDDVPLTDPIRSTSAGDINPFDLDRVEILKGPQGTLFGSASLAGAVRYITEKPAFGEWSSRVSVTGTRISEGGQGPTGALMLNVPLDRDTLALRLVGLHREEPGYIDELRRGEKDVNRLVQNGGRALLSWLPSERSKATFTWLRQNSDFGDSVFTDQPERLERSNTPTPGSRRVNIDLKNLLLDYEFDWGTLSSSTARVAKRSVFNYNGDRVFQIEDQDAAHSLVLSDGTSGADMQELRLTSPADGGLWKWIVGGFYQKYRNDLMQALTGPLNGGGIIGNLFGVLPPSAITVAATQATSVYTGEEHHRAIEQALYGEASRVLFEDFELTLGTRFYRIRRDTDATFSGLLVQTSSQRLETRVDDGATEKGISPKLSLAWRPFQDFNLYGLISRGFRPGGVQVPVTVLPENPPPPRTYKSDVLWNYEIGLKSRFFEQSLTVDLAAFYLDWKDFQISVFSDNVIGNAYIDNIGRAHSRGLELALNWRPAWELLSGFNLISATALIDARTDETFTSAGGTAPEGTRLPLTPRLQTSNTLLYQRPLWGFNAGTSISHSYAGQAFNNVFESRRSVGDYQTWDVQLSLASLSTEKRRALSLTVNNLTDERVVLNAFVSGINNSAVDYYLNKPRSLSLNLTLEF